MMAILLGFTGYNGLVSASSIVLSFDVTHGVGRAIWPTRGRYYAALLWGWVAGAKSGGGKRTWARIGYFARHIGHGRKADDERNLMNQRAYIGLNLV
jgi:hypothetical protein